MRRLVLLVALCVGLCSTSVFAMDYYLQIEGISGDVVDGPYKGSIEVQSWSWGTSNVVEPQSGLPTGKRQHKPMTLVKRIDKSSPQLYEKIVQGKHFTEVHIVMVKNRASGQPETVGTITLSDVVITSIRSDGGIDNDCDGESEDVDLETVSLVFQKISWEWTGSGVVFEDEWRETK